MRVPVMLGVAFLLVAGGLLAQGGGESFQSGLKVGESLPGPFDALNINGKKGKDRQHCLVCEFALNPVVAVFARESADAKDSPLTLLLAKLDETVGRHTDDPALGSFAIFLSPDALN